MTMFTLDLSDSFFWPCRFRIPRADGSGYDEQTFDAEFRRLSQEAMAAMLKRAADERLSDAQLAREILVGWKGVVDAQKAPVPFSQVALDRALNVPGLGSAVMHSFFDAHAKAVEKN